MADKSWWIIDVAGYGDFAFYGTEAEAEERRAAKAEWEGGVGKKRLSMPNDPRLRDRKLIERAQERTDA